MNGKNLKQIVYVLDRLVLEGKLEPDEKAEIAKAIKELSHALKIRNIKQIEKAIEKISKLLLRLE
ncbi:MAG TPA: hypothetical protein VMY36_03490 [Patescibacteria group bacterium]|nr:hypothetical protein [Patescibacteria group bacterium]